MPKRHTNCDIPNETLEDIIEGVSAVFDKKIAESEDKGDRAERIAWLKRLRDETTDLLWGDA